MIHRFFKGFVVITALMVSHTVLAQVDASDIFCTIRDASNNLNCQWVSKDSRKVMNADDIMQFIDRAEVAAYVNVRSRKGYERTFLIDSEASQFRRLTEIKKTGSISEISRGKNDLFAEIEKRVVRISDELDAQLATMELVKYDSSIAVEKYKRDLHRLDQENPGYDQGPSSVANGNLPWYKYEIYLGAGASNTNVVFNTTTSGNKTASPTFADVIGRLNWSERWSNEFEYRSFTSQDYDAITANGTNKKGAGLIPTLLNLTTSYCPAWYGFCAGIDLANYNFVGSSDFRQVGIVTENYISVGISHSARWEKWATHAKAYYGQAVTKSAAGTLNTTGGSLTNFNFIIERKIMGNHVIAGKASAETIKVATDTTLSTINATTAGALMYKYAW